MYYASILILICGMKEKDKDEASYSIIDILPSNKLWCETSYPVMRPVPDNKLCYGTSYLVMTSDINSFNDHNV